MKKTQNRGFSLVELMVSLSIFAIVMTVSVGTLLVMIDANAKAQALYQSMTNLSFAADSISRNLRTANSYFCGTRGTVMGTDVWFVQGGKWKTQECTAGEGIVFTREKDGRRVGYRYYEMNNKGWIEQRESATGSWVRLTSEDVVIKVFRLSVEGVEGYYDDDDISQPRIVLRIEGYVDNGLDTDTDFVLQTNVTQQVLNY